MTVNIHGKEYTTVAERVLDFQKEYKNGSITTEIIESNMEQGNVIIKATIIPDTSAMDRKFTGHAFEFRDDTSSMVNKASWVENAETSAIGRAMAALGIGVTESYASANEVQNKDGREHKPVFGSGEPDKCQDCGAPLKVSKAGKSYCSAICWEKN